MKKQNKTDSLVSLTIKKNIERNYYYSSILAPSFGSRIDYYSWEEPTKKIPTSFTGVCVCVCVRIDLDSATADMD